MLGFFGLVFHHLPQAFCLINIFSAVGGEFLHFNLFLNFSFFFSLLTQMCSGLQSGEKQEYTSSLHCLNGALPLH